MRPCQRSLSAGSIIVSETLRKSLSAEIFQAQHCRIIELRGILNEFIERLVNIPVDDLRACIRIAVQRFEQPVISEQLFIYIICFCYTVSENNPCRFCLSLPGH